MILAGGQEMVSWNEIFLRNVARPFQSSGTDFSQNYWGKILSAEALFINWDPVQLSMGLFTVMQTDIESTTPSNVLLYVNI